MTTLTSHVRHGAEHAWASLAQGWHELRARTSDALTHFRRDGPPEARASLADVQALASADWGLVAADIRLGDDTVVVRLEVPGMRREDLHIDVNRDRIIVWGDKRLDAETRDGDQVLVQCAYGSFRRELVLPRPVDADRARASYQDGVLRVEVPRLEAGGGYRIAVR